MTGATQLSIIVVPLLGGDALERCLTSLERLGATCVVVLTPEQAAVRKPRNACHVELQHRGTVPQRRAFGIAHTTSDWVVLLEDTCEVSSQWLHTCRALAERSDIDVVGGPVVLATDLPPRAMALGAMEYGEFSPEGVARLALGRRPDGMAILPRLAGLNLLYRRGAIARPEWPRGLVEMDVNREIVARGGQLLLHDALVVTYARVDRVSADVQSRFSHGRIYGGGARQHISGPRRLLALLKCLLLPAVLTARAARGLPSGYPRGASALAWIAAFAAAWSAGELVGFMLGRGASLEAWR
jgi:hypothetical protein